MRGGDRALARFAQPFERGHEKRFDGNAIEAFGERGGDFFVGHILIFLLRCSVEVLARLVSAVQIRTRSLGIAGWLLGGIPEQPMRERERLAGGRS